MDLKQLREALAKANISQVAALSGVSRMTVNRVKRGDTIPNMGTFERLVKAVKGEASPAKVRKQK